MLPIEPAKKASGTNTEISTTVTPMMAPEICPIALRVASQRRQPFLAHDALDVLDHHDGVVHHDADHQHHAEHGQHVDREAQRQQHGEGAQQRDRHHDGRDDGVAQVLQEQEHHQEHQHHRLEQRLRPPRVIEILTKRELSYGMVHFTPCGKKRDSSSILARIGLGRGQRVAARRQLHADADGRLAVQARRGRIGLAAELDARDVAQPHGRAVGVGAQHDVAELLDGGELAVDHHRGGDRLARRVGQVADGAGGHLRVLRADGRVDVGRRQVEALQLGRVDPDAHRALGAEQLRLADAGHALDFGQHVARRVVAQRDRVDRPGCRTTGS